jgi:hypothetical protein
MSDAAQEEAMPRKILSASVTLAVVLALLDFAFAQDAEQSQTLIVDGHPGQAAVIQVKGHSYADLEALARILNGSLSFNGNQIILRLPASASSTTPSAFSKGFLTAAIEAMAAIREWRSAIATAIRNSYPVTDEWMSRLQNQATDVLQLASAAASTATDRSALQLLTNEYNNLQSWSSQIITKRKNLEYISADDLNNDPLFQQILTCANSLASMFANGHFQDDPSCH